MDWKKIHQFPTIQMLNRFGNSVAMTESTQPRLRGTRRSPLKAATKTEKHGEMISWMQSHVPVKANVDIIDLDHPNTSKTWIQA